MNVTFNVSGVRGHDVMYAPDAGLYTSFETKSTIDAIVDDAAGKNIDMPLAPFLRPDLYDRTAKVVNTAYVIGRVKVFDQAFISLFSPLRTPTGKCG